MKKTNVFLVILGILLFGIILIPTIIQGESGTYTIHEDSYVVYPIYSNSGDSIEIYYAMRVTDGPNIDIYFVDSENYQYYQNGDPFGYYSDLTGENRDYHRTEHTISTGDTYYLIFDNTDVGTDPPENMIDDVAYVDYTIHTGINNWSGNEDPDFMWLIIAISVIVIVLIIIIAGSYYKYNEDKDIIPSTSQTSSYPQQVQPSEKEPTQQIQKRYCSYCGKQITISSKFCTYCGNETNF